MQPLLLKYIIRALATFIALSGCFELWFSIILLLPSPINSAAVFGTGFKMGFAAFSVALGSFLIYVGYLSWFRWSPLAVRQVIGASAVFLFGAFSRMLLPLTPVAPNDGPGWLPLLCLPLFALTYVVYRWCTAYCCAHLFPPAVVGVNPSPGSA